MAVSLVHLSPPERPPCGPASQAQLQSRRSLQKQGFSSLRPLLPSSDLHILSFHMLMHFTLSNLGEPVSLPGGIDFSKNAYGTQRIEGSERSLVSLFPRSSEGCRQKVPLLCPRYVWQCFKALLLGLC